MIRLGNSTLPNAIPIPIKVVPINNNDVTPLERSATPTTKIIIDKNRERSTVILRDIFGTIGDTIANASRGMVVIKPATTFEICNEFRISSITGPTDVRGERRVNAMKTIPSTRSHVVEVHLSFFEATFSVGDITFLLYVIFDLS